MSGTPVGIVDTDVGPLLAPIDPWIWPCLIETGSWEPLVGEAVRSVLSAGDTVINVGAHVGYYTRMAALAVGHTGIVWAYEPAPSNRRLLEFNISGLCNVAVRSAAVSDETGTGTLTFSGVNPGDHRLGDVHPEPAGSTTVPVVRLDDEEWTRYNPGAGFVPAAPARLIFVDAQGFDLKVLRGARDVIDAARPHVMIEWTPNLLDRADYPEIDRLIESGYTAHIVENGMPIGCASDGDVIGDGTGTLHLSP
jgi:FkbM family methyltransferase